MKFVSCITGIAERLWCKGCGQVVEDEGGYHVVVTGDTDTPEQLQCGPTVPLKKATL